MSVLDWQCDHHDANGARCGNRGLYSTPEKFTKMMKKDAPNEDWTRLEQKRFCEDHKLEDDVLVVEAKES
jgi:hypothetical protein